MVHLLILIVFSLGMWGLPAQAQRAQIQQRLSEATNFFNQQDFFMGVNRITDACSMLKSNPSAMPETSYSAVASKAIDEIFSKMRQAKSRGDVPSATRMSYAVQPLLNTLAGWDPKSPLWHYKKGIMFQTMSALRNDQYPGELKSAVQEFDTALSLPGNDSFRANAEQERSICQKTLQRRGVEIVNFKLTHPEHNLNNLPKPSANETTYCVNCGREKYSSFRCPFCGF
jgi:hypothetical protein